jgi:glutathione S-transferase
LKRVRKEGLPQRARIGDPADVGEGSTADGQVLEQQLEDVMGLGIGDELQLNDSGAGDGPHSLGILASNKAVDMDQYGIPGLLGEVHRHTLEESDRIKKCTVEREGIKRQKEMKKVQKTYHKKASGQALQTVKRHSKANELKLFGSCFCPFVQRVWIALEVKGLNYQYIEVDPYKKPQSLLEINPRGLVPALKHGDWGCYESTVLLEYLEDLEVGTALLPQHPQLKATSRLWVDHVNRNIVPGFYRYLQAQEQGKQIEYAEELRVEISKIVDAADAAGPFFLGPYVTFVDVSIAPWLLRLSRVLHPYRGWPVAEPGSRLGLWVNALESSEAVKNTVSSGDLYLDSYERYAENRPDTSQLAKAVNSGRGLP